MRARILSMVTLATLMVLLAVSPALGALQPVASSVGTSNPVSATELPVVVGEPRVWTDDVTGVEVLIEERSLYAKPKLDLGVSYPNALNYIPYLRYAVNGTSGDSTQADAVIVALSGLHAGNNCYDTLGKQLVSKAKNDRGMNVELWALDRRVNNLEDLTGLNEAERLGNLAEEQQNPDLYEQAADALDGYYYGDLEINGKTFQGFLTNGNAYYLSEFGLRVAMEDIYTLIKTVFPSRFDRRKKVYLAGDSLGAVETADFACWDFDGNPDTLDDIGYNNIAGVIAFDALMTPNAIPINQDMLRFIVQFLPPIFRDLVNNTSLVTYTAALAAIRGGVLGVLMPTSEVGYVPTTYLGVETIAMMADALPDDESEFYQRIANYEIDPRSDAILRLAMSRDILDWLSGLVLQKRVRWTNEALFGMVFDNNFNPITMNQSAMGFLTGGSVGVKTFPFIGDLDSWLPRIIWDPMSGYMPYDVMYIPSAPEPRQKPWTGPLYSWVNHDEIDGTDATRYTSSSDEVSDLHDVAKCSYEGPSNIAEWYYTTRLFADIMIANADGAEEYGLNLLHVDDLDDVPTFIRLNREGTNIGYARMNGMDTRGIELPGQHLDVLMMDMEKNPNVKNLMLLPMCDWMKSTSDAVEPEFPAPTVTGITPKTSVQNSVVGITNLAGTGFQAGAKVRLEMGGSVINASSVSIFNGGSQITCTLDLNKAAVGSYDVVVENPDGCQGRLAGGFSVTAEPVPPICGAGAGSSLIILGLCLGLLSLAGSRRLIKSIQGGQ